MPVIFPQHISWLWCDPDFKYEETSQQEDVFIELAEVHSHGTSDAFKKRKILC